MEQQLRALGFSPTVLAWIMSSFKTTAQGSAFAFDLDGANKQFYPNAFMPRNPHVTLMRAQALRRCLLITAVPICGMLLVSSPVTIAAFAWPTCLFCPQNPPPRAPRWHSFALKMEGCRCRARCSGWKRRLATSEMPQKHL